MSGIENAIVVENVHKTFKLPHEKHSGLKQLLLNFWNYNRGYEKQHVLRGVSFEIEKGDFFGIVGRNGSGKSTLLKLLAGIYAPDEGLIQVNGKLTPFIELGVGFNPELTGRENIYMNGALLGFSNKEIDVMYDEIVEFAELRRFMDQKLKNYSSGMQVRLAFSIAIRADSPILLLDEVLAVGDALFQKKCYEYFKKLKHDKKTVILVSHDTGVLQEYCNKGVLIEQGEIITTGEIDKVVSEYIKILNASEEEAELRRASNSANHVGAGQATIGDIDIKPGRNGKIFTDIDDQVTVNISYQFNSDVEAPIYGLTINDAAGARIAAVNNLWSNKKMKDQKKGDTIVIEWEFPNIFNTGTFYLSPAVADSGGTRVLDQVDDVASFKVSKKQYSNAATNIKYKAQVVKK